MNKQELIYCINTLIRTDDRHGFSKIISTAPPADIIDALADCTIIETCTLLNTLPFNERANLFSYFPAPRQDELLQAMATQDGADLFKHLPSDDRADVFNRLSHEAGQKLLRTLDASDREDILKMSAYDEGSAGSVTSSDFVTLSTTMTVDQALAMLRSEAINRETIDVLFVLDKDRRLLGSVTLRNLVMATPDITIGNLMKSAPVFTYACTSKDVAAELIRRHDLLVLPVLNDNDQMIGIITVDDAMDVEKHMDATQLARFGGTAALGGPDLDLLTSPFRKMFGTRLLWLSVLTLFGILISNVISAQEHMLSEIIILAAFIAPIIDMGGNTGSQSAALVIRGMALGDINLSWRHVWMVVRRELPIAFGLGVGIAILEVVLAYFSKGIGLEIMLVVGLSMLVCTATGGIIGAILPFLARRIGTDPATLSSPLITSIMDMLGVLIYFGFAYLFLAEQLVQVG